MFIVLEIASHKSLNTSTAFTSSQTITNSEFSALMQVQQYSEHGKWRVSVWYVQCDIKLLNGQMLIDYIVSITQFSQLKIPFN